MASGVQVEQAVHAAHVHREDRSLAPQGIDMTHDAGSASVGDEARPDLLCKIQEQTHLLPIAGVGNPIRPRVDHPGAQLNPIGQALATCMPQPLQGVGCDQAVHGQPGIGSHFQDTGQPGVFRGLRRAKPRLQEVQCRLRQRVFDGLVPPTIPAPHRSLLATSHRG